MNNENKPQTASEKAAVMVAFDRGEKVEVRSLNSKNWGRTYSPNWDWVNYEWRVALKPIEGWIWVHLEGTFARGRFDSKSDVELVYPVERGYRGRAVFMREVIE